jgi:glycosyltransferase involved in cell wall biosynthesis
VTAGRMTGTSGEERPLRLAFLGDVNSVHTRRWAVHFADRGHEIHLLVPDTDSVATTPDPRLHLHTFRAWPRTRVRGWGALATRRSLQEVLREIDPDVLHSQSVTRYGLAAWLSGFHPYVITVWGSDVLIVPGLSRRRRISTRLALRGADLVTGGSDHLVRAAVAAGAPQDRTSYVHIGVDTERFGPGDAPGLRARLGLGSGRIVLSPRTIAPLYRQGVVVEAFSRLPADTILLMTRHLAQEAEIAVVQARAEALGVAERVRIVPGVSEAEVPDLYRLADVVVSVPISDGGPNTIVEALASGRPIVASDLPPNREWLAELDPAGLVPVDDAQATGAALAAILARSAQERSERAARGRSVVVERADQRTSMAHMEELYRNLANRRRRRA